jgi:hypothetical protein
VRYGDYAYVNVEGPELGEEERCGEVEMSGGQMRKDMVGVW